jgi:UDP-N-acetylmuramate dehydrogenase
MTIDEHVPLASMTTLGVGGKARYFAQARDEDELREAVEFARARELRLFVLGGGSNVVVVDAGFNGLVLRMAIGGVQQTTADGRIRFAAGAGVEWDRLVAESVEAGCAGIECLSGIPGTVGGTPVQNVGAYGQEVSETITEVRALDLRTMQMRELSPEECGFGYRISVFNTTERGRYIVVQVTFELRRNGEPALRYADLQRYFAERAVQPTLAEVREAVRAIRHSKAMLIVAGEEDSRSVGSFFKNPTVTEARFEELAAQAQHEGWELPGYAAGEGRRKLPAARLVEKAGFARGYAKGRAGISRKHTLAIVNRGGASAAEIVALKDEIQERVKTRFGVELMPEPVFIE